MLPNRQLFFPSQKKLIKELPSLVPSEEVKLSISASTSQDSTQEFMPLQEHGDMTTETSVQTEKAQATDNSKQTPQIPKASANSIGKSPGEVAFFKLLHTEFNKVSHFFDRAIDEFAIREDRVSEGMKIMKQPNSIMVNEKWSLMAKSIFAMYKDLLLLETFAIMTYCSFSKILKKHDKVTGYSTREAFMKNIVNKANFTHYPKLLEMISRCERMYEEVSNNLLREGKEGLYEDERLFINMINRLNEQVLTSEDGDFPSDRARLPKKSSSSATSTLRSILEQKDLAHVEGDSSDDPDTEENGEKRVATDSQLGNVAKRQKVP